MAAAVDFPGSNKVFAAPPGREDVSDLHTFVNGHAIVSAWRLTPEELVEVNRTGLIFVSSLSGGVLFPLFVGAENEVRRLVADYGDVWRREPPARQAKCSNPCCAAEGTAFPVIGFGPDGHPAEEAPPYRLEVPRSMCSACQAHFQPEVFFAEAAREGMTRMITDAGRPAPDFSRLTLVWLPLEHPIFVELGAEGAREARLWFG